MRFHGSWTRLVIRKRTGSAWERARVAPVRANSHVSDARARGLLQCATRITRRVREPIKWRVSIRSGSYCCVPHWRYYKSEAQSKLVRLYRPIPFFSPNEERSNNHLFQTMERLIEAVLAFFRDMAASPDIIRQVTGLAA